MNPEQLAFLNEYLAILPKCERDAIPGIVAESFCADEYNANECARLINEGIKKATCSLKAAYEIDEEPLPKPGHITVVLDWDEQPVCIVKTKTVKVCAFNEVSEDFAVAEGEGDGSYEWWRTEHVKFFEKYSAENDVPFSESSDLILERFEKVYPI